MWLFNSKDVTKSEERPFEKKERERENVELGAKRVGPSQKSVTQPLCAFVASAY